MTELGRKELLAAMRDAVSKVEFVRGMYETRQWEEGRVRQEMFDLADDIQEVVWTVYDLRRAAER